MMKWWNRILKPWYPFSIYLFTIEWTKQVRYVVRCHLACSWTMLMALWNYNELVKVISIIQFYLNWSALWENKVCQLFAISKALHGTYLQRHETFQQILESALFLFDFLYSQRGWYKFRQVQFWAMPVGFTLTCTF